jgi:hypothetical protein
MQQNVNVVLHYILAVEVYSRSMVEAIENEKQTHRLLLCWP